MKLRIFRQPTKDIQPNGEFYIDTLQYKSVTQNYSHTSTGISGIPILDVKETDWVGVEIIEANSYLMTNK